MSGINGEWGGAAYRDLVNLVQYVEQLPYIDITRAALAGASFGGYMVSWIFSTDLAKKVNYLPLPRQPMFSKS